MSDRGTSISIVRNNERNTDDFCFCSSLLLPSDAAQVELIFVECEEAISGDLREPLEVEATSVALSNVVVELHVLCCTH